MKLSLEKVTSLLARVLKITPEALCNAFAPAQIDQLPAILAFRSDHYGQALPWDDAAYLRWRYDFSKNTAADNSNCLWVLCINGQILGAIGVDHVRLRQAGNSHTVKNPLDLLVKAELDGFGLGVWMSLMLEKRYPVLFAMGATRHSQAIVKKCFTAMPDLGAWKLLINSREFLSRRLSAPALVRLGARFINAGLSAAVWLRYQRYCRGLRLLPISDFTAQAAALEQLQTSYAQSLVIFRDRSAAFLQWRFMQNPRRAYQALGVWRAEEFMGYAVYHPSAKNLLHIDDIFVGQGDDEALAALVLHLAKQAQALQLSHLALTAHAWFYPTQLRALGLRWRDDGHLFGVSAQNPADAAIFLQPERWRVTSIDTHSEGF
jgi:hypothetical protein